MAAAIPIPTFTPAERCVEGWGEQAEPDGHVASLDEVELVGLDEGVEEKMTVEIEDEDAKAREAGFELKDADEKGELGKEEEDEEKEDDAKAANSCCGDGASKVSTLGTEQSKLPEP